MSSVPLFAYRRNLEPIGEELRAGPWRITPLLDLVSEKRFLLMRLKARLHARLLPSVLGFRGEAASIMAPESCPPALATTIEGDRIEILTEYFDLLTPGAAEERELEALFETVFDALFRFEASHFVCGDLFPQTIGRTPSGGFCLLPNAYILPHFYGDETPTRTTELRAQLGAAQPQRRIGAGDESGVHAALIAKFIANLFPDATVPQTGQPTTLRHRLLNTSEAIRRGEVTHLRDAYQAIFLRPVDPPEGDGLADPADRGIEPAVDETLDGLAADGSVVVIVGDSYTNKTNILRSTAAMLNRSDAFHVFPLDEWDLFSKSWKKATRKGPSSVRNVWIIDDIDEKALAFSDFATAMRESATFPRGSVVMSIRSSGVSAESEGLLAALRKQRHSAYHEIHTEEPEDNDETARLSAFLSSSIAKLGSKARPASTPTQLIERFLSLLEPEQRQLLEFMSVARFSMPLDLVRVAFSEPAAKSYAAILRLTALDCLRVVYRKVPGKNVVALFLRMESTALRRAVYDSLRPQRRRKLHRTIALLGEQQEAFPKYLLLFHSLGSNKNELIARHVAAYLRETPSAERHPHLVRLCVELARANKLTALSFAGQILVNQELSVEMLKDGRGDEAEQMLQQSLRMIDEAEDEIKLKNAQRLSATFRLLADRWEARGEFKRALRLLETAREDLQSALAIPDQAQLLNDIGWLQYRLGDYAKSMESCRLSLNTLSANQYPMIVAQALNLMGVVHFNTSRYDEAISYYEQSAFLRERAGDENALAASFNNLALAYQSKGEIEKAFDYHNRSLKLKKRQENHAGIAAGYLNLAFLHLEAGNLREAEQRCRESLKICEEVGNAQLAADNYTTLGDIALADGDLSMAEHHYQESRRISHQRESINEEMGSLRRLSSLSIKQERFAEAREYANAAYALVERIGSRFESAQIEMILGDLEIQQERYTEALANYEKAASQFTALSKYRMAATVLSKIGLIHTRAGNDVEARNYYDRAQEFVRADIGRELPEEFVELQTLLREHPARALIAGRESQKLLMAFHDLSILTDYAADPIEFVRKTIDVATRIIEPIDCYLLLKIGDERFAVFDRSGHETTTLPESVATICNGALQAAGLVDSRSPEAVEVPSGEPALAGKAFLCVPLKAMSEDVGCLFLYVDEERLPLSLEDANFFNWLGRQIAGNTKLMLHLNDGFLVDDRVKPPTASNGKQKGKYEFERLIGKSEAMKKVFRTLEKVRDADTGILILGESGTGKSALARVIHQNSPRTHRPFQEIHCAQIPHNLLESELFGHERGSFTGAVQRKMGLVEAASGGTLFLDDINVIPVETQTKLLHFLESKSFMRLGGTQRLRADVRIVAASNEDLEALCREGRFREDLYYRLKVILIDLPPLRERKDDMIAIALDYLRRSCAEKNMPLKTLSPEAIQLFQKAQWRGNVRELRNVLERVVVLSDETVITPSELPEDFLKEVMGTSRQTHERLDELVDEIIQLGNYSEAKPLLPMLEAMIAKRMVAHVNGKTRAAGLLGVSKPTLYARLRDFEKLD